GRREGRSGGRRAALLRAGVGSQGPRVERRVAVRLPGSHGRSAGAAARADRHHRQGRAGQGADLVHPGVSAARDAFGLLTMRSAPIQHRGVALILVLTTIAILTSIGVDFSYSSRVSLKLAENLRDETRAEYLAKSAVNLSRLLLHFQKQVDQLGGQVLGIAGSALGGASGATTGGQPRGATPQAMNNLGIRLWQVLPIDSNAFGALLSGDVAGLQLPERETPVPLAPPREKRAVAHAFGGFEGSFHANIVDENSRINVQALDNVGTTPAAVFTQLRAMMA